MMNQIQSVFSRRGVIPATVGVLSFTAGALGGYVFAVRKGMRKSMQEAIYDYAVDLQDAREAEAVKTEQMYRSFADIPQEVVDEHPSNGPREADDTVPHLALVEDPEPELDQEPDVAQTTVSIFGDNEEDVWDWEEEGDLRTNLQFEGAPYILHVDEFMAKETPYAQATLTYYEGDEILVDDKSVPVYNISEVIGDNLRFGHGSNDRNMLYIRNDHLRMEFEVIRDRGYYQQEVLGIDIDEDYETDGKWLKHSNEPLKFKLD